MLTTGVPYYGAGGSLGGFNVSQGLVTVRGAGLNAANVDQVDLIARAVQANATIYARNLNVITGANRVDHDSLAAAPIAGTGTAPAISIDVSQLGGMYANRVFLGANEYGVGVSNQGVLAAGRRSRNAKAVRCRARKSVEGVARELDGIARVEGGIRIVVVERMREQIAALVAIRRHQAHRSPVTGRMR